MDILKTLIQRYKMRIEWPTVWLLFLTYLVWGAALWIIASWSIPAAIVLVALAVTLHSSLQHEVLHGHPFGIVWLNEASVWPAIGLFIPYQRFRDTHLAHHTDANLTDPYDDPETNFFDPAVWDKTPRHWQVLLRINNTLAGRMVFGPLIGTVAFLRDDLSQWRGRVWRGWLAHLPAAALVLGLVTISPMPIWAYLVACYAGLSVLKIRTFLEHRAHDSHCARTVVIDDQGPLALLFLNNNYHVVHHMNPTVPWYELPALYHAKADRFLSVNDGYFYSSYTQIFRRYLFKAKDPVPHPLWPRK
jgi:fatty acid desaturase